MLQSNGTAAEATSPSASGNEGRAPQEPPAAAGDKPESDPFLRTLLRNSDPKTLKVCQLAVICTAVSAP